MLHNGYAKLWRLCGDFFSDSSSSLTSLQNNHSYSRPDILIKIHQRLLKFCSTALRNAKQKTISSEGKMQVKMMLSVTDFSSLTPYKWPPLALVTGPANSDRSESFGQAPQLSGAQVG